MYIETLRMYLFPSYVYPHIIHRCISDSLAPGFQCLSDERATVFVEISVADIAFPLTGKHLGRRKPSANIIFSGATLRLEQWRRVYGEYYTIL